MSQNDYKRLTSYILIDMLYSVSSYMLTWKFAVHLNRSPVELVGFVIEKTEVAYLKSFPCVVVKKTFKVTCRVASFQIQKMKLILFDLILLRDANRYR